MFHNLSGYDAHLFIKELGRRFNKNDIGVIAENKEKYISFNVKINVKLARVRDEDDKEVCKNIQLRFIDSCRFGDYHDVYLATDVLPLADVFETFWDTCLKN